MKILTTERLILENAALTDAEFFLELLNGENWIEALGDKKIRTIEGAEEYIQDKLINSYENNGFGLYKVSLKESGTPIGICGFVKRDYLEHADIGYGILPGFEGNGYAFEAALAVIDYGKVKLNFETILAITDHQNQKSRYLLNKLGFLEVGNIQQHGEELILFSLPN